MKLTILSLPLHNMSSFHQLNKMCQIATLKDREDCPIATDHKLAVKVKTRGTNVVLQLTDHYILSLRVIRCTAIRVAVVINRIVSTRVINIFD